MFIASKYVDYYPLKMPVVVEKIGHGSFSQTSIKAKEIEIMQTLHFTLGFPTALTLIEGLIERFQYRHHQEMDDRHWNKLKKIKQFSIYLAKMALYDYPMLDLGYVSDLY